ncbi:3'-5' exonuclease [Fulvivirgaceae bacterium PWU4]|uniref:3'-5' exonuclease n=1 Tax=Chryseosolibacter histidini TaxID=2782349 RepID=A0AAP2DM93_9BACT|nr:3'-5' exonuclease [Chryseosolibacter histidini]MBT1697727.1 3'-5' exonuclease [Chryseosolibacter histidini]
MKLNLRNPICFFDLETTGVNITHDRIIEIAVIKVMPNGEVHRKTNLLNPGIPIPPESSVFHGIYDEDVKDKPTFKEVAKEYAKFIEGADLSGFSILKMDVPMLVEEFLRAGVDFDYQRKKIIDAQKIFHLMEKRTLAAAYRFYMNKELQESHTAEADAEASMEVLLAQVEKYDGQDVTDISGKKIGEIKNDMEVLSKLTAADMVDLAGRMIKNEKGEEIFNFGKHKSKKVTAVLKEEPAYYDWMMNGDFPQDTKRKLTEIKLRGFKK